MSRNLCGGIQSQEFPANGGVEDKESPGLRLLALLQQPRVQDRLQTAAGARSDSDEDEGRLCRRQLASRLAFCDRIAKLSQRN